MKELFSKNSAQDKLFWNCTKLSFIYYYLPCMIPMILQFSACPYPVGVCRIYDFNFLFSHAGSVILIVALVSLSLAYLLEVKMVYVTGVLAILTAIIISHHESNGVFRRSTAYTLIWFVQFWAYLFYKRNEKFDLQQKRHQYVVQIIAALYALAAFSKIEGSGLSWVSTGADLFPIQIFKNYAYSYFDTMDYAFLEKGQYLAYRIIENKVFIKFLLAASLLLESCCLLVCFLPRIRLIYGLALMSMHIGIYYFMNIYIDGLADPMVVFFINPLYWFCLLALAGYKRILSARQSG